MRRGHRYRLAATCASLVVALGISLVAAASLASAHRSGCHAAHTCPSDHHTYVWKGLRCTSYAAERRPSDTVVVKVDGRSYYCTRVSGGGSGGTPAKPRSSCGVERWAVKTLTDPDARKVVLRPRATSVRALTRRRVPRVGDSSPRIVGIETHVYRVRARLVEAKIEADSDVHLVIADRRSPKTTMIVELPASSCTTGARSALRRRMASARKAFVRACGTPPRSGFRGLGGEAVLTGVGFVDTIHGQRGVAPNGIELHPLLTFRFRGSRCAGGS